jgi:hypothetical protein
VTTLKSEEPEYAVLDLDATLVEVPEMEQASPHFTGRFRGWRCR